jgi:hypothetical protein
MNSILIIILKFLLTLSTILLAVPSFAIVNGKEFSYSDLSKPLPYVGLKFDLKGLPSEMCTATYLGNGKFLTAAHCFLLNEYDTQDLKITIENASGEIKINLLKEDYFLSFAPVIEWGGKAPTRKTHAVIRIPKPDMAIMTVNENIASQLPPLATVKIDFSQSYFSNSQKYKIVGQGCTNYISFGETMIGQGVFRIAPVLLENTNSEVEVTSIWNPINLNGGVCWGDSGGALLLETREALVQVGVVSSMKTKHDPATGKPALVTSRYGRLDNSTVKAWLK